MRELSYLRSFPCNQVDARLISSSFSWGTGMLVMRQALLVLLFPLLTRRRCCCAIDRVTGKSLGFRSIYRRWHIRSDGWDEHSRYTDDDSLRSRGRPGQRSFWWRPTSTSAKRPTWDLCIVPGWLRSPWSIAFSTRTHSYPFSASLLNLPSSFDHSLCDLGALRAFIVSRGDPSAASSLLVARRSGGCLGRAIAPACRRGDHARHSRATPQRGSRIPAK